MAKKETRLKYFLDQYDVHIITEAIEGSTLPEWAERHLLNICQRLQAVGVKVSSPEELLARFAIELEEKQKYIKAFVVDQEVRMQDGKYIAKGKVDEPNMDTKKLVVGQHVWT